ncbi:MAG TPA: histidine phosphatase family protein [Acidimicrobiia bacterium]|nr:histidine phosphatase family protein [Acidimicrobiia bacterium]
MSPADAKTEGELWLVRHGETEWSKSGQHTGATDVPLTEEGRRQAEALGALLRHHEFARVLSSPKSRALETCRLAGYGDGVEIDGDLVEWDYGEYEGRTTADIRKEQPGWTVWSGPVPGGETPAKVAARTQRVIDRAVTADGGVALFAHGHVLRVLAATWLGLPPEAGRWFALGTATLSVLGHERETRVIQLWNRPAA